MAGRLLGLTWLHGGVRLAGGQEGNKRVPGEHSHRAWLHVCPHCGKEKGSRGLASWTSNCSLFTPPSWPPLPHPGASGQSVAVLQNQSSQGGF